MNRYEEDQICNELLAKSEDQIEEMAKKIQNSLSHCCLCEDCKYKDITDLDECQSKRIAEELLKHYQPKLTENSVIIPIEEYRYFKDMARRYDPFWFCAFGGCEGACKECKDTCEMSIFVKERKKIADKIINFVTEHCDNEVLVWQLEDFVAKQFKDDKE